MTELVPLFAPPEGIEWVVLLVVVLLLFGAGKLPDIARNTGRAIRIFKAEAKALHDEDKTDS